MPKSASPTELFEHELNLALELSWDVAVAVAAALPPATSRQPLAASCQLRPGLDLAVALSHYHFIRDVNL
ncbi:hypothetical protein AWZ03_009856 [Drosophila navojoa]|uniref:Uncharacterized protein n=1 Tax=Drosophila navojoa TaxID=7232 RepID=A0A484B4V9_DRONA|nr:hypothetical protein AWZ03_009856 [Drosophila navojoa]